MLKKNGLIVDILMSDIFIIEDPDFLYSNFSKIGSKAIMDFLILRKRELSKRLDNDGAILISWNELSDRIIKWENFAKKYPNLSELKKEALNKIKYYIPLYLEGSNNSPVFNYNKPSKLKNQAKESYEIFIKKHPDSAYYQLIKDYYYLLRKNDFKYSKEVKDFIDRKYKKHKLINFFN